MATVHHMIVDNINKVIEEAKERFGLDRYEVSDIKRLAFKCETMAQAGRCHCECTLCVRCDTLYGVKDFAEIQYGLKMGSAIKWVCHTLDQMEVKK